MKQVMESLFNLSPIIGPNTNECSYDDHKLKEQKEILSAEVIALRRTVEEQNKSLERIYKIVKYELLNNKGELHYILTHFKDQLNDIFTLAKSHMGGKDL